MYRTAVLSASAFGVLISACGSLDSNTGSAPTLATIQGKLTNSLSIDVPSTSDVRVAVVWRVNGPGQFNVAEDLPVQPVFPYKFTIALNGPPPEQAMNSEFNSPPPPVTGPSAGGPPPSSGAGVPVTDAGPGEPDGAVVPTAGVILLDTPAPAPASRYAIGTVVAYLDDNHNGKLDLVADSASAYVDQILAANQNLSIAYFEGPILEDWPPGYPLVDAHGHRPKDGYNLLQVPVCTEAFVSDNPACTAPPPANPGGCSPLAWLGMDSSYALDIATSPEVSRIMCLQASGPEVGAVGTGPGGPFDPSIQPAKYPDACDPNLTCAPDGSDYLFATCMKISRGLCKDALESCTSVGYARPTPAPPDWPCAK